MPLQSRQEFEKLWSDMDDCSVKVEAYENSNGGEVRRFPSFPCSISSTVDATLDFKNVKKTIQKVTSFSKYDLHIQYGNFYRIMASSESEFDRYGNHVDYFLNPSQELRPGPVGERYAPDAAASEFKMLLDAISSFGYLEVALRDEAWMEEDGEPSSTTIEIEYSQSIGKAARLQLDYITHDDLLNLPSWSKAVLSCLGIHGIPDEPTKTFSYASIIQSSEGLSELRKLEFTDCEMSWEMWESLFRSASIQKHLEQLTVDSFNRENQIVNLSGIGRCKALKDFTLMSSWAEPGRKPCLHFTDAYGLQDCCKLSSLSINRFNLENNEVFDFLPILFEKSDCPIKASLQRFACASHIDESGWDLFASCLQDFKDLQEVDLSYNSSLTHTSVDSLVKGVFNSDTILRFLLPTEYENHIDEELKHHLNMNKAGRRIVYRSPDLMPSLAPVLLGYASKNYPLSGVFSLLRNDLDLAMVLGGVKKRKRKSSTF